MSSFLVNLARRGAGLPSTTIQAPPPSPFGPELGRHVDEVTETPGAAHDLALAETPTTSNTATHAPLRASSSEEPGEPSPKAPTHHTPSAQRLSGTEPGTPKRPSVGELAITLRTPSLGLPPAPRRYVLPNAREAQAAPVEPPQRLDPAVPSDPTELEDVTEGEVERDLHTSPSVVHDREAAGQPARHASSLSSISARVIQEPDQKQGIALPELSPERPLRQTALPAPTIRPALAESSPVLDFPRVPSHSSLTPPAQLPIHVRIGRVEIRATTASTPTFARPSSPAPVGFAAYYRMRNYRS
jgi:hypothetical protein